MENRLECQNCWFLDFDKNILRDYMDVRMKYPKYVHRK